MGCEKMVCNLAGELAASSLNSLPGGSSSECQQLPGVIWPRNGC